MKEGSATKLPLKVTLLSLLVQPSHSVDKTAPNNAAQARWRRPRGYKPHVPLTQIQSSFCCGTVLILISIIVRVVVAVVAHLPKTDALATRLSPISYDQSLCSWSRPDNHFRCRMGRHNCRDQPARESFGIETTSLCK